MSRVKFKLKLSGLNELMKSPEMLSIEADAAARIAAAAGDGYAVEVPHPIAFVGISSVRTDSREAYKDCMENDTLQKAAQGVRI